MVHLLWESAPRWRLSASLSRQLSLLLAAPFFCGNQFPFPSGVEGDQPSNRYYCLAQSGAVHSFAFSRLQSKYIAISRNQSFRCDTHRRSQFAGGLAICTSSLNQKSTLLSFVCSIFRWLKNLLRILSLCCIARCVQGPRQLMIGYARAGRVTSEVVC